MLVAAYFSDENSVLYTHEFLHPNPIEVLQSEIAYYLSKNYKILGLGDFNARVGHLVDTNNSSFQELGQFISFPQDLLHREYDNIPTRRTKDVTAPNRFGRLLSAMLQTLSLIIFNGRTAGDPQGELTCFCMSQGEKTLNRNHFSKGSIVDLAIGSADLLSFIDLTVLPFPPNLQISTNHKALQIQLQSFCHHETPQVSCTFSPTQFIYTCRPRADEISVYTQVMQSNDMQASLHQLYHLLEHNQISATNATSSLCLMIQHCFKQVKALKIPAVHHQLHSLSPNEWFDEECRQQQQLFDNRFHTAKNNPLLQKTIKKQWKSFTRSKKRQYLQTYQFNLMKTYFSNNQSSFWRVYQGHRSSCAIDNIDQWTEYFRVLLNAQHETPCLTEDEVNLKNCIRTCYSQPPYIGDSLNQPIDICEILAALEKFKCGKSADLEGLTEECLKFAQVLLPAGSRMYILLPIIYHLFTHIFQHGNLPQQWTTNIQCPIFKGKGSEFQTDNYRGIAIGSILAKLFSSVLDTRLQQWAELHNLRACSQTGFRHEYGTQDALFTMRTLIETIRVRLHRRRASYLFVCFVDFQKAFDSVNRNKLIERCQQLGIHGPFLQSLINIYKCIKMRVRANGCLGPEFMTTMGTKQGDPLSPTLFGLFIEQLDEMIQYLCPNAGISLSNKLISNLLYADDLTLLAEDDPKELQKLLNVLSLFCKLFDLQVNCNKTIVVVFRGKHLRVPPHMKTLQFTIDGKVIPQQSEFSYLGMKFHQTKDFDTTTNQLIIPGNRAMHSLLSNCRIHSINIPKFICQLFDVLVKPTVSYASQIWGPDVFLKLNRHGVNSLSTHKLEKLHCNFLRLLGGTSRRVNNWIVLKEYGRYPLQVNWLMHAFRFWNKLCSMPNNRITFLAFAQSIELMLQGYDTWATKILECARILKLLPVDFQILSVTQMLHINFNIKDVRAASTMFFDQVWHNLHPDPRAAPPTQVIFSTYLYWSSVATVNTGAAHVYQYLPRDLRVLLLNFRMGSYKLQIVQGRFHNLVREDRICKCCCMHTIEDMHHFLIECKAYELVRMRYCDVFEQANGCLKNIFNSSLVYRVCHMLKEMDSQRQAILNTGTTNHGEHDT